MTTVWTLLASVIEGIANFGAGLASTGMGYEPVLPKDLQK